MRKKLNMKKMTGFKIKDHENIDRIEIISLCHTALMIDGGHHKQWYLEEILKKVVDNFTELKEQYEWEDGIPD